MTKNVSVRFSQSAHPVPEGRIPLQRASAEKAGDGSPEVDAAERMVRKMMAEQAHTSAADRLPELAPPEPQGMRPAVQTGQKVWSSRRQQWQDAVLDSPDPDHLDRIRPRPADPPEPDATAQKGRRAGHRRVGWPGGIRIGRGPVVLGVLVLLVIWKPGLVLAVVMAPVILMVIAYLTVGHDRIAEISADRWRRFEARWPKRAERLRKRADALALTWDTVLDRLPESWAERLALPDVSRSGGLSLDDAPDPFERLAKEARDG